MKYSCCEFAKQRKMKCFVILFPAKNELFWTNRMPTSNRSKLWPNLNHDSAFRSLGTEIHKLKYRNAMVALFWWLSPIVFVLFCLEASPVFIVFFAGRNLGRQDWNSMNQPSAIMKRTLIFYCKFKYLIE